MADRTSVVRAALGGLVLPGLTARRLRLARREWREQELAERAPVRRPRDAGAVDDARAAAEQWRAPGRAREAAGVLLGLGLGGFFVGFGLLVPMGMLPRVLGVVGGPVIGWFTVYDVRRWARSRRAFAVAPGRPVLVRVLGWDLGRRAVVVQEVVEPGEVARSIALPVRIRHPARALVRGDELWLVGDPEGERAPTGGPPVLLAGGGVVLRSSAADVWRPEPEPEPEPPPSRTRIPGVLSREDVERRGR